MPKYLVVPGNVLLIMILCLAGCTTTTPTPNPDGPVLTGFNTLPKALATIILSPTPNEPQAQATIDHRRPTVTLAPATFTPTPTPYIGVFMGQSTFSAGSLLPTGTRPVAVVTAPPGSGRPSVSDNNNNAPSDCSISPSPVFVNAAKNQALSGRLGCPTGDPYTVQMVAQAFEKGFMFWRDTKEIYVVSTAALRNGSTTDTFWRVVDSWNDTLPANDPGQIPPAGLLQPVRGFGFVWRNNASIRNNLGWALSQEQPFSSTWQNYQHGWMMTSNNGAVLALIPMDGPPVTTGIHFGPLS